MADRLAALIQTLGWGTLDSDDDEIDNEEEKEVASSLVGDPQRGVTLLSHSK